MQFLLRPPGSGLIHVWLYNAHMFFLFAQRQNLPSRHYQLLFKSEAQYYFSQWNWHQGVAEIGYFQTNNIASNWNLLQTYKETTGRDSWSSLYDAPIYDSEKGKSYLILSPQETSEDSGSFRHIGLVDTTQVCSQKQNLRVRGVGGQTRHERVSLNKVLFLP